MDATKMSAQQAAWLARQKRQGHVVGKHAVLTDGRMSVRVGGTVYVIRRDGTL